MRNDTIPDFPNQIQPRGFAVTLGDMIHDPQPVYFMRETGHSLLAGGITVIYDCRKERFSLMTERGMPDVMGQADGFRQILIQIKTASHVRAADATKRT